MESAVNPRKNKRQVWSHMPGYIFAALCSACAVTADYPSPTFVVKGSHTPSAAWSLMDAPKPDDMVIPQVIFCLKSARMDELTAYLDRSSDPFDEIYGQHLTAEQVDTLAAPSDEASTTFVTWLTSYGINTSALTYSSARECAIWENAPVSLVEQMLDTKYSLYEHESGDQRWRTTTWSVPEELAPHIDTIQPTNSFMHLTSHVMPLAPEPLDSRGPVTTFALGTGTPTSCYGTSVTCKCLRDYYGTTNYNSRATTKNSMSITNYLDQNTNKSDLIQYCKKYRPPGTECATNFPVTVYNNGRNYQGQESAAEIQKQTDVEGNLDGGVMNCIGGAAPPPKFNTFNTGGSDDTVFQISCMNMLSEKTLPYVVSTSYGDNEQNVPMDLANNICECFRKLGVRGTTVLFSSGDDGVGKSGTCKTSDGKPTYLAVFPASCPYVTAVGGTRDFNPERVAYDTSNGYIPGGGFSRYFPRPSYQNNAVPPYISQSIPNLDKSLYNSAGRGYPDVSAQSYRYAIVWNGGDYVVDGTSCSAPAFGGIVTLLNDYRLANNRSSLGFMNPWIYAKGYQGLTDITMGSVTGCDSSGFPAATGWDAASGYGTPNFQMLLKYS